MELMFSNSGKTHVLRTGSYSKSEALCGAVGEMSRGRCVKMRDGHLITCRTCLKLWYKEQPSALLPFIETNLMGPTACPECKKNGLYVGVMLTAVRTYCEKCGHQTTYKHEREIPKLENSTYIFMTDHDSGHTRLDVPMLNGHRLTVRQVLAEIGERGSIEDFARDMDIPVSRVRGMLKDLSEWDVFKGHVIHSAFA